MTVEENSDPEEKSETRSFDNDETNPYLALRAAKIARNEARLAELGLLRPKPPVPLKKKRAKPRPTVPIKTLGLRRSPRHTNRSGSYLVPDPPEPREKRPKTQESCTEWSTRVEIDESVPPPPVLTSISNNSVRSIELDVGVLCEQVLGMCMEKTGKAHVVEESVRRTSDRADVHGLSFNKYSGVQEWKNDALFLWVNLGGKGQVINDFMAGGKQMTWFGGSRIHDESNVIRRLLRVGQLAKDGRLPSNEGIVLWCRRYCPEKRTHGPYVCLGRLAYHSHLPGSRPLQFVWSLLDYDQLKNHEQAKLCFNQ